MTTYTSLKSIPKNQTFKKGDLFILFGELFGRGYANGLVKMAQNQGMKIIGATVGRREKGILRPLNQEEIEQAESLLGGKLINIPLEAGFDLEALQDQTGKETSVVDWLADVKIDDWPSCKIDFDLVKQAKEKGKMRFEKGVTSFLEQVQKEWQPGQNIFFAHIMAGGIPRAKIMLVIANRVFKGRGERYIHSGNFWNSDLGKLTSESFDAVTADTFQILLEKAQPLLKKTSASGDQVVFTGYGYHGTEILVDGKYQWQTYTPYQQGHAKKRLENYARKARQNGIQATIYNCPEIRTNSSDIFLGVELSLFPLLYAFQKEGKGAWVQEILQTCQKKLTQGGILDDLLKELNSYFLSPFMKNFIQFQDWPKENTAELAELMVGTSERVAALHFDRKDLITDYLSSIVIANTGQLIFHSIGDCKEPVIWLGHEWIAKQMEQNRGVY